MANFNCFYAERLGDTDKGEPYIAERGVFNSLEEFLPYREAGWEGTKQVNEAADAEIKLRKTPEFVLHYIAPMWCGEKERGELLRRQRLAQTV